MSSETTIPWPRDPFTVLTVDDDPLIRELMKARLENDHCRVVTASDGLLGLQVLEQQPVDIVLLDLEMPRMNGFEVLDRIRSEPSLRKLPVIVVSSLHDVWSIGHAFGKGATSFVVKPFDWPFLECQLKFVLRASRGEEDGAGARAAEMRRAAR